MSTGYRLAATWGEGESVQLTLGVDLRYLKQELEESQFRDQDFGFLIVRTQFDQLIPRSHSSNPGLFFESVIPRGDRLVFRSGARFDWASTNLEGDPQTRQVQTYEPPLFPPVTNTVNLRDTLGAQHFTLASVYGTAQYEVDCHWTALAGLGYAGRPPTLTELYAEGPFMPLLQQGRNFVFGDPQLQQEQLLQIDVGVKADYGPLRAGVNGFYAWVHDYITMELGSAQPALQTRRLTFVNTDLATLSGGELYVEYDYNRRLTPFARMSFVEGRDHTRDDRPASFRQTSIPLRDPTLPSPGDEEPLPGIAPLESRLGLRLHEPAEKPRWGIELAARVVDNQDRVATSLLEKPTPGFTTYDLRSYWQATDSLLLLAGVENFTDKQYQEHLDLRTGLGVFQPGVNFYFGIELS